MNAESNEWSRNNCEHSNSNDTFEFPMIRSCKAAMPAICCWETGNNIAEHLHDWQLGSLISKYFDALKFEFRNLLKINLQPMDHRENTNWPMMDERYTKGRNPRINAKLILNCLKITESFSTVKKRNEIWKKNEKDSSTE